MKPIIILSFALSGICCSNSLIAQQTAKKDTTLTREMTLEREYNPTIRDASKINFLPEIKDPEAPKTKVEFANFAMPFDVKPQLSTLKASSYMTELDYSKKRGYLSAGISPLFLNINGDLGYQILNSEANQLNIWGSHRSSNGDVKYLQDDENQKMKINDNVIGLDYKHKAENISFWGDVNYTYSAFNYYGYGSNKYAYLPWIDNIMIHPAPYDSALIQKNTNQVNNIFDLNLGVKSNEGSEFGYLFKLNYSNFNQKYGTTTSIPGQRENFIQLDFDLNKDFNSETLFGLSGGYMASSYSNSKGVAFVEKNPSDIRLNPYLLHDGGNWSARLGLTVDLLYQHSKNINVAPDIEFNYRPKNNILLYLSAKGGMYNNSMKNMYYENRYVYPGLRIADSSSSFDGLFGVKTAVGHFGLDVFVGYKNIQDEHFYIQTSTLPELLLEAPIGNNFSFPEYESANLFRIGGNLTYSYSDNFNLGLKMVYNNWNLDSDKDSAPGGDDNGSYAWNKPKFESDFTATYKLPNLPLKLDLMYRMELGRKAKYNHSYILLSPIQSYNFAYTGNMKNIHDLNLKGTYTLNDTFSFFLKANNLLFQRYDLWYGYPAQGFNIMAGVNILF